MTRLIVSVRNADEAAAALAAGADLIDVKEPTRGPLGAADRDVIEEVISTVGGQAPVSAAGGEATLASRAALPGGLDFVKFGFADAGSLAIDELLVLVSRCRQVASESGGRLIVGAYADFEAAQAPPPERLSAAAVATRAAGVLIDTWDKDQGGLWDFLAAAEASRMIAEARERGLLFVLAGSLREEPFSRAAALGPDYCAVRGAACRGARTGAVDGELVRQLRRRLDVANDRAGVEWTGRSADE